VRDRKKHYLSLLKINMHN